MACWVVLSWGILDPFQKDIGPRGKGLSKEMYVLGKIEWIAVLDILKRRKTPNGRDENDKNDKKDKNGPK